MQIFQNQIVTSIGHGNRTAEDFVFLLKKYDIEVVIDVRSIPFSRFHPQFRKHQLQAILKGAGIQYLFFGDSLGGRPKDPGMYVNGKVSYSSIKNTEIFKLGIKGVTDLVTSDIKVTLMCSELDQNKCHRKHLLSDELERLGINILHINKNGILQQHNSGNEITLF